jgi:hypothetical protein
VLCVLLPLGVNTVCSIVVMMFCLGGGIRGGGDSKGVGSCDLNQVVTQSGRECDGGLKRGIEDSGTDGWRSGKDGDRGRGGDDVPRSTVGCEHW